MGRRGGVRLEGRKEGDGKRKRGGREGEEKQGEEEEGRERGKGKWSPRPRQARRNGADPSWGEGH